MWASLLFGEVLFLSLVLVLVRDGKSSIPADEAKLLYVVDALLFAAMAGLGFVLRSFLTRAGEDGMIDPGKYFMGTIVFLAGCEAAALFGIVNIIISGHVWPAVLVPGLAMLVQAISFPTGNGVREE